MVTRTITTTTAKIMCLNVNDGTSTTVEITLPRTYKDDKAVLKQAKETIETEEIKAVHVISTETSETLYGMTESEFIQYAKILPPRGTKSEETEETEETNE